MQDLYRKYLENEYGCVEHLDRAAMAMSLFSSYADEEAINFIKGEIIEAHERLALLAGLDDSEDNDIRSLDEIKKDALLSVMELLGDEEIDTLRNAYSLLANLSYEVAKNRIGEISELMTSAETRKPQVIKSGNNIIDPAKDLAEAIEKKSDEAARIIKTTVPVSRLSQLGTKFAPIKKGKVSNRKIPLWLRVVTQINDGSLNNALINPQRTIVDEVLDFQSVA
jgi:hypothetical protein